jgi:predicted ArsR family transcriptional regulator
MEMGGEYEARRDGIVDCTNCLFAEVCRRAPVTCRFHAGIIEGLLERSGLKLDVKVLGFRDPDGCAFALEEDERAGKIESLA